ncbi:adenine nucleotide alpha hydrolases-like protein [Annulohypoxylon maeteangense]|uniref:adenine nucleotide alpha hydrolases-like protein n=1 Tax=Annulohypoxylon maeteangense TaxID=1927788 RepID=UPI002007B63F|nr:adenine nucleotide alpha hydrolases-like protein [Annulohypoxylon maeteangense]KAI0884820.1 adenine nucleotide alpha hydrolases-like protein [Annulohypoxylon maeteangense]
MGTLHHVLHTGARPIGLPEFVDAVRATCPRRFTQKGTMRHRRVALAVSGGVDSMALAFLCSSLRKSTAAFEVSDNPVNGFRAMVIDHGLREGSYEEALAVCEALKDMSLSADVMPLNWSKIFDDNTNPRDLPNFESVARKLRYERLGHECAARKLASLFLAHHEDDQYETILMRLLQGHGSRGLRGMKKAHDIPECENIHGAHQSGWVDDQMSYRPFYKPLTRTRKHLHRALQANIHHLMDENDPVHESEIELEDFHTKLHTKSIEPNQIPIEDGGVMVYRPLLEFSKDRLIATCLENNVPWWEDSTNHDPTLTIRNAIRKLYKGYALPKALQKPAILALAKRCEQKHQAQDAEANRLLRQVIIHDFEPNAGTVIVQFPKFESVITKRDSQSPQRRQARLARQREIASIVMRKVLMLVSPEKQAPSVTALENHVWRLFPSIAEPGNAAQTDDPKTFSVYSVLLTPITPDSPHRKSVPASSSKPHMQQLSWHLSRAPYPAHLPIPRVRMTYWSMKGPVPTYTMSTRNEWMLWDGRYWFHAEHQLPHRIIVQPFLLEHSKPFRELLQRSARARLDARLKRYAPGKTRYTLPGLYLEEDVDLNRPMRQITPRGGYPNPIAWEYRDGIGDGRGADRGVGQAGERRDQSMHPKVPDTSKMKLIALPTLDIQIPGLSDWIDYEIRYRKVDRKTLRIAGTWSRGSFGPLTDDAVMRYIESGRARGGRGVDRLRKERTEGRLSRMRVCV